MSLLVKNMSVQRCYIEASSFITVKNLGPAVEYGPCQDLMGKAHLENRLQKPVTKTPGCSDFKVSAKYKKYEDKSIQ